jgi:HEPN domain-containing protein
MSTGHEEWFRQAEYDAGSAAALLEAGRCAHAVFFCHLAVEKALKGLYAVRRAQLPPRTHNLLFPAKEAAPALPDDKAEFLFLLNRVSALTRYPDDMDVLLKEFSAERTKALLEQTRETLTWLKGQLPKS